MQKDSSAYPRLERLVKNGIEVENRDIGFTALLNLPLIGGEPLVCVSIQSLVYSIRKTS